MADEGGLEPRTIVRGLEYGRAYASVPLQVPPLCCCSRSRRAVNASCGK
jgi:hypothetical protein